MSNKGLSGGVPGTRKMAPDFTLPDVNGAPVTLSKVLGGKRRALVVFLRHLG